MVKTGIDELGILRRRSGQSSRVVDQIIIEEPLQIRLRYGLDRMLYDYVLTMRTPGHDKFLVAGLLLAEGVIGQQHDIVQIRYTDQHKNELLVELRADLNFDPNAHQRSTLMNSSCGVCGKGSIEDLEQTIIHFHNTGHPKAEEDKIYALLDAFNQTELFGQTGANHAAVLFDDDAQYLMSDEDVGRHNALDKLLGRTWYSDLWPLKSHILLLSGRISFELMQKALIAGIPIVVAVGAPSSLAVELGGTYNATVIGFLKKSGFNIYTGAERIKFNK